MGRWLRKAGRTWKKAVIKFDDTLLNGRIQEQLSKNNAKMDNIGDSIQNIVAKGRQCASLSRETVQVCQATETKREEMIAFASEIQATFNSMAVRGGDSSILETIKNLTDGSKVRQAMNLAKGLEEAAMSCVTKSVQMLDLMEEGLDALPEFIQNAVREMADDDNDGDDAEGDDSNFHMDPNSPAFLDFIQNAVRETDDNKGEKNKFQTDQDSRAFFKSHTSNNDDEELLVKDLSRDYKDVETVVYKLQNEFNLVTAMHVGLDAFTQLTDKGKQSKALFVAIQRFATSVSDITQAFRDMNVSTIIAKCRDILKCIGLLQVMREVATGAGKLLKLLVSLFQATADRISTLWNSLAFAKDCMQGGMALVQQAQKLCRSAEEKSMLLISKSRSIHSNLSKIGKLNRNSITAMRQLSQNGEIQETIDLVQSMDDVILECSTQVSTMIEGVTKGIKNIPPILTDGMDIEAVGQRGLEIPEPWDVDQDVRELDKSRQAVADADLLTLLIEGQRGFEVVSKNASICQINLKSLDDFAAKCSTTINSFLSVWDLESAINKVQEMCRLVQLGELMKQLAIQLKQLLLAISALLKEAFNKLSKTLPNGDMVENIGTVVDAGLSLFNGKFKDKLSFLK